MKKTLTILIIFITSVSAFCQNTMYVRDTSALAGDTVYLEIWVDNIDAFNAFQFDIEFSEDSFYCISDSVKLSSRTQGHALVTSFPETNKLRVFAYSMNQNLFTGISGSIVKLCFVALPNQTGDFPFLLTNAILSGEELNNILNETINGKIRILEECSVNLNSGWTWLSLNLSDENMLIDEVLSSLSPLNGDYIKNQTASATYYDNFGWFGGLDEINIIDMYKIHLENPDVLIFSGIPSDPINTSINIFSGWNWIGYIPNEIITIETALSSLNILPFDYIKDQTNSSTYYENFGWFGELSEFQPHNGYMLKVSEPGTLIYPTSGFKSEKYQALEISFENHNDYNFNPHSFEYNGSITSEIIINANNSGNEENILYAFASNICCGKAKGILFPPTREYIYNLMIYSNIESGEEITFRFYNSKEDQWYEFEEKLNFESDMIEANAFDPFELKNGSIMNTDWMTVNGFSYDVYPNPFNGLLNINFDNPKNQRVNISIFDGYGRKIRILKDRSYPQGNQNLNWDGKDLPNGMYYFRIQTEGFVMNIKLVKVN